MARTYHMWTSFKGGIFSRFVKIAPVSDFGHFSSGLVNFVHKDTTAGCM